MSLYGKKRVSVNCEEGGPSLTKQSFRDEADINKIIAKYEKTGMLENLNQNEPFYGDVSELMEFRESLGIVAEATELFSKMDAHIREKFENDPAKMIDYLADPNNLEEAEKLGMVVPRNRHPNAGGNPGGGNPGGPPP